MGQGDLCERRRSHIPRPGCLAAPGRAGPFCAGGFERGSDELAHCPRPVAGVRRDRDRGRRALVMRLRLTGAEQEPDRHGRPCPRLDKQRASAVRSTSPGCSVTGSAPLDCSARWAVVSSVENTMMESCNPAVDRPAQPRAMTSGCLVISVSSLAYQWFSVLTPAAQASGVVWCRRVDARTTSSGVNRIC